MRDAAPQTYVFWVHASTQARFKQAYTSLADRLELPGRLEPQADVLQLVSDWLCDETNGQWLMVLDNVDDVGTFFPSRRREQDGSVENSPVSLAAYLPQSRNGSILITSRNKDAASKLAGGRNKIREVLAMDKSQCLELLRIKLEDVPYEEEAAVDLVHRLDCMPLAITQAAAYINRQAFMTIARYVSELCANDKRRESLLHHDAGDLRRDESASNSVVATWQMSFERIRQERPSAADLLSLMSFFNPQGIPEKTLRRYSRMEARADASENEDEADHEFEEDINTLHAYSLITTAADDEACEMHALVQFCTQVWLASFSDVKQWQGSFIELMSREFPSGEFETWSECQQLFPHIESLFDSKPALDQFFKAWMWLSVKAAWYMFTKGSYKTAEMVARKAAECGERVLGTDHEMTIINVENLATVLASLGKYEEAIGLYRQVLHEKEKKLGAHDLSTLRVVNNLATVLEHQHNYGEAKILYRRAFQGLKDKLGTDHRATLRGMANLANILRREGEYKEAEKLSQQTLEMSEKKLGAHHLYTLATMSILAAIFDSQGKWEEAERLHRQALQGHEKTLGDQHPETLKSVHYLAQLLHTTKRYEEAAPLYQRAYDGFVQKLGSQHPSTIACGNGISRLQKEANQTALVDNQPRVHDEEIIINPACEESAIARPGSKQKDKQDSFLARIKEKMRKRE
jgi:tetratricopeptide (TPR) repeat protein